MHFGKNARTVPDVNEDEVGRRRDKAQFEFTEGGLETFPALGIVAARAGDVFEVIEGGHGWTPAYIERQTAALDVLGRKLRDAIDV